MDPLTQGLLGAAFGQALYGKALGKQALAWGAVVGMAPDLDVVANPVSPMAEWLWHRGPTHALWFGPVVGPLLGWLLWRWRGGRFRDWAGLSVVALLTHPLLDAFTTYGTQLLSPFSSRRFAWDAVAIVDPVYSLVLALAIALGLRRGVPTPLARRAAWTALALSSAYVALGLLVNHRAEAAARAQLAAEGLRAEVARTRRSSCRPLRGRAAGAVGWVRAWHTRSPGSASSPRGGRTSKRRGHPRGEAVRVVRDGEATPRRDEAAVVSSTTCGTASWRPRRALGVWTGATRRGAPPARRKVRPRAPASVPELLGQLWRQTPGASDRPFA
jgi:membrane-bound metal-dependent hydrolase YbcI (DUF457 family)